MQPLPLITAATVTAASATVISIGTFVPSARLWGNIISRGTSKNPPRVALTFDDGPTPGGTDCVLDVLAEMKVRATFFVIGKNVERHPDLLRRIDAEGHLIANHTFDHRRLSVFGRAGWWRKQIERTDAAIKRVIGRRPAMFRPPVGHKTPWTMHAVRKSGHAMVTWNVRSFDGLKSATPQKILDRLLPRCRAGDIVVLHDGVEPGRQRELRMTVEAVRPLILGLRERGLEPVRVDELVGAPGYRT